MTGAGDITQLCFYSNLAGIVANKIEQSFYSVYSYSGIESIKHALSLWCQLQWWERMWLSSPKTNAQQRPQVGHDGLR